MHKNVYMLALLLALFLPFTNVVAQGTSTTATVVGTVSDSKGNPLPGATVIAVHKPSGTIFGTSSRADGKYTIQNVRVGGPYEITSSFVGYNKYVETIKYLALSQVLTLNILLVEANVQLQEMTVVGTKDPILNSGRTGAATSVLKEQIEKLPTINRSFQDFSKLSPMFSGSSLSAGGRNSKLNNIQLDGAQYNDMFGLGNTGTPGGQANTNPISLDAIQEFQVVIAPFDVRQSGFTGGGINAITRSGTNIFDGSVYYYNRNENFVGKSPNSAKTKYSEFSEFQAGFRAGGPIIKDKLFFFANGEISRRKQPISNNALISGNYTDTLAKLSNIVSNFLRDSLKYNGGTVNPFTVDRPSTKFFFRFDYNLAENHNLTFRNNFVQADDDIIQRNDRISFDDRYYTFKNSTNSTVLQLTSTFGNQFANELTIGYTRIRDKREVNNAFPSLRVKVDFAAVDIYAGTEEFSIANQLDQDIIEFTDNFSYFLGEHVLTFGTHNEFFTFRNMFIRNYYGMYTFNSVSDLLNKNFASYAYRYSLVKDPKFAPEFAAQQFGFYVQDEWSITPDLKTTLGVRLDLPVFPDKPGANANVEKYFGAQYGVGTNILPKTNALFSPRVGVNWDVFGDKSTIVRGGIGMFTGKIPYVWISNQYSNTGLEFAEVSSSFASKWGGPNVIKTIMDPYNQPRVGSIIGTDTIKSSSTEINVTDPDFKMPQVLRVNLGLDQKLPMNLVGSADFLYSKNINDILYKDINLGAPKAYLADGRPVYGTSRTDTVVSRATGYDGTSRVTSVFPRVMYLTNTSDGYQMNASIQVQGEPIPGLGTNVAYNYGVAKDRNSVLSSQAQSQFRYNPISGDPNNPKLTTSNFEIKHRILASVSYTMEFVEGYKTTISLFYNGQSGRPISYIYGSDANGDGHDANDLIYIPTDKNYYTFVQLRKSDFGKTLESDPTGADRFWAYVEGNEYLRDHKGQITERNADREPWVSQFDLHISQLIPTVYTQSLEISLDILNVANLLNSDWGWVKQMPNQTNAFLTAYGKDANGKMRVAFSNKVLTPNDLLSRFQMQLGLRYNF